MTIGTVCRCTAEGLIGSFVEVCRSSSGSQFSNALFVMSVLSRCPRVEKCRDHSKMQESVQSPESQECLSRSVYRM